MTTKITSLTPREKIRIIQAVIKLDSNGGPAYGESTDFVKRFLPNFVGDGSQFIAVVRRYIKRYNLNEKTEFDLGDPDGVRHNKKSYVELYKNRRTTRLE